MHYIRFGLSHLLEWATRIEELHFGMHEGIN